MSSRRLPNSDNTRILSLNQTDLKANNTATADWAISNTNRTLISSKLPLFKTAVHQAETNLNSQNASIKAVNKQSKKLAMFVSHFLQVFLLGIKRGIFNDGDRKLYGLDLNQNSVPEMPTDEIVRLYADKIVDGEATRMLVPGAVAMAMPAASEITTEVATLITLQGNQTTAKTTFDVSQEALEAMRVNEIDPLIKDIYDEVEFKYRQSSKPSLRRKAREWGVVYVADAAETPDPEEASLYGKVTGAVNSNSTTNAATIPGLDGVTVRIYSLGLEVSTDEDGDYLLPPVPIAASYDVEFSHPGYTTYVANNQALAPGQVLRLNVKLMQLPTPPTTPGVPPSAPGM